MICDDIAEIVEERIGITIRGKTIEMIREDGVNVMCKQIVEEVVSQTDMKESEITKIINMYYNEIFGGDII